MESLASAVRIARRASSSDSELLAPAASKMRACKGCQRAKTACNQDERPCARCVRLKVRLGVRAGGRGGGRGAGGGEGVMQMLDADAQVDAGAGGVAVGASPTPPPRVCQAAAGCT